MAKRYRKSRGKLRPLRCLAGGEHDFAETLYATPSGYLLLRETCRACLLAITSTIRFIPDPSDPKTTA